MLRVEADDSGNTLSVKLEGRFTGDEADSTRTLMTRYHDGMRLIVDLTEVTLVDSVGEQVLLFFGQFGAEFVGETWRRGKVDFGGIHREVCLDLRRTPGWEITCSCV